MKVVPGPEGYMPKVAALEGVSLPSSPNKGLLYGEEVDEEIAMREAAKALLTKQNPTIFPGPKILWGWSPTAFEEAEAILELAKEIPNCRIIPMPDYRPKYPKIDPEAEINPNHPNLTILHNKIEACIFVGVHCHYANLSLRMIRAGTNCFTIAICGELGHEDAMVTLRDAHGEKIRKFKDILVQVRNELGIQWEPKLPPPNPSLPKENWETISFHDYGEYVFLLMPKKGEIVTDTE
ncbi:MAG: carbon monoxide dehydrogenase beta subunit family protein [Hydrogenothermaceae bacterium]